MREAFLAAVRHPLAVAAGLTAAATLVAWPLDGHLATTDLAMVYLLAVVAAAFRFGRGCSVWTSLLSVVALNFFFVPPRLTLRVEGGEYLVTLAVLLAVSLVVSGLATRLKAQTAQARLGEQRALQINALGAALSAADEEAGLVRATLEAVLDAFRAPCAIVLTDAGGELRPAVRWPESGRAAAVDPDAVRWVLTHRHSLGRGTRFWPELEAWYVPLIATGGALGAMVVDLSLEAAPGSAERPGHEDDPRHLETVARQAAMAIERHRMALSARASALEAEAQSMRSALLASISHDLRTPLAAIAGAASALRRGGGRIPPDRQAELLHTIEDEAVQMAANAENILQLARLSSGTLRPNRDWESPEEVVGTVAGRLRRRAPGRVIRTRIERDLPLVRMDAVLIAQVLSNLVENALRHTPEDAPIDIDARRRADELRIAVLDRGAGIAAVDRPRLFTAFQAGAAGGAGLGLALCKAVVEAHGGRIRVARRPGGGSVFRFALPCAEQAPAVAEP